MTNLFNEDQITGCIHNYEIDNHFFFFLYRGQHYLTFNIVI